MRGVAAILAVSVVVPLPTLSSQPPPVLEPGTRVRVTATDCGLRRQATTVEALRGDTLVLPGEPTASSNSIAPLECPLDSMTRLEVSRGRKSHWLSGMGLGLLAGAGIGALAGGFSSSCTHEWGSLCTMVGAGTGASLGLLTGLTIGALVMTERWERVPLDRVLLSFAPERDGFALGMSVSF